MLKRILPHIIAIASFLVISIAYFAPQLQGKVLRQGDIVQNRGMAEEHRSLAKELGEPILWTNAMFGGMPTYQITTVQDGNLLRFVNRAFHFGFRDPIGLFLTSMICFYILMMSLNVNPWIGMVGSIAFGLTTNNFVLYEAGHLTKIQTIAFIPLIAAGVINAFNRKYLLGGLLFALGVGLNIFANHVQMSYYFFLTLVVFGVAQLIIDARKGEIVAFGKAVGVLLIAGLIGIGSSASNLLTTYEYSQSTMRGAPILEQERTAGTATSSSEVEGLDWEYAMTWSNGTLDLFSTFIPRVNGSSGAEPLGSDSEFYKDLRRKGAQLGGEVAAPLYWGALPFTSGSPYFGAIIVFLFILGLFYVKGAVKWWLALGVVLTFILSMGMNMAGINKLLFDTLPLLNKFRTPNSVLSVTAALVPILSMLALVTAYRSDNKESLVRPLYISAGIAAAIALFFAFVGPGMFDFAAPGDARLTQAGYDVSAIQADRATEMRSDALRTLIFVLLGAGLLWAYLKGKLKFVWVAAGIGLLTTVDLWQVNQRYISKDDFVTRNNYNTAFNPRPVDQQIMSAEPNRGTYRVMDVTIDVYNAASTSYFHNTVGGYHPAKLQRIQDVIDRYLSNSFNQEVLDMLNTKYFIIQGQNNQPQVQQNPGALGNAWFVDTIRTVPTANAEIDALATINTATTAAIHQEYQDQIAGLDPNANGTITFAADLYRPDHLIYNTNTSSEQLAVFSEIWYGPDKGWNAYIDGEKVSYLRANYLLRALKIPAGEHKVEFIFEPSSYANGKVISLICSALILLSLIGYLVLFMPKEWKVNEPVVVEKKATPAVKKPTARKSKKRKK
ncbi:MAG: hypothetical protein AAGI23_17770 [Bacteroidota bacterium]